MCLAPGKEVRWRTSVRYVKSPKKYQENCKKCLTNGAPGGNICKLSDERPLRGREGAETAKNLEKREKSSWQKEADVVNWTSSQRLAGTTLYLVNWITKRQTRHLGQLNGLFKRKRKNSQRKFLSNNARSRLFKKLILGLKRFKIPFFESLILAQDERWRRA